MLATNYSNLRENMKEYFDKAADSFEPLIVTRKNENMVIMSQTLYDSLMETVYLMSNSTNHEHLRKSIEQYSKGQITEQRLTDDDSVDRRSMEWLHILADAGQKTLKRINSLIKDILQNGNTGGIGKPEALLYDYHGFFSRRIDEKNRLVYIKEGNNPVIISLRYHYR